MFLRYSHYYYRLKGEYTVPMTPKGWFSRRHAAEELNTRSLSGRAKNLSPRRSTRNRLIVSQSMVIDIDPNKVGLNRRHYIHSRLMK